MVLSDRQLLEWGHQGGLNPFDAGMVNPASVDLRWSGRIRFSWGNGWGKELSTEKLQLVKGSFVLLDSLEFVVMPDDCCGTLVLKSSMGRKGLEHLHAGWIDPGFRGTLTWEVEVRAPWAITLEKGQPVMQLVLMRMDQEPDRLYAGRYQDQRGPTEAR